jgi:hypothetical protein
MSRGIVSFVLRPDKVTINSPLSLRKQQTMKKYGEVEIQFHVFLNSEHVNTLLADDTLSVTL